MANLNPSTNRYDPYKNFKFQILFENKVVAGVSKVSALTRSTEVVSHRIGGDHSTDRKSPGQSKFEAITLERGVTQDPTFEEWATKVWNYNGGQGGESALANFRKDITLQVCDESGKVVLVYHIYNCWVSEYQALPELDSSANAIAIQHIKIENEGWERDTSVVDPLRSH
jgi:phage tail-like protein